MGSSDGAFFYGFFYQGLFYQGLLYQGFFYQAISFFSIRELFYQGLFHQGTFLSGAFLLGYFSFLHYCIEIMAKHKANAHIHRKELPLHCNISISKTHPSRAIVTSSHSALH